MRCFLFALLLAVGFPAVSGHAHAAGPEAEPAALFEKAHAAYVAADYATAEHVYRTLIAQGHATSEVWYNLGNTLFHAGRLGEAILHYRRAWLLAPRDADSLANLNLAAQRTGATLPEPGWWSRYAHEASASEWRIILLTGYWILLAAALLAVIAPGFRRFARPVILAALFTIVLGAAGWSYWHAWLRQPEAVVLHGEQTARYEPRTSATPYFSLPEGSIVRIEDTFDAWMKVAAGGKSGWIERSAIEPVYPWQPGGMR